MNNNWNLIRLILALIVLFTHLTVARFVLDFIHNNLELGFINSYFAVKCFFFISGFFITSSYISNPDLNLYCKRRLLRIYPPIVISVILILIWGILSHKSYASNFFTLSILLMQDWTPLHVYDSSFINHGAFWTLVVEMQFYIILPVIISFYKKKPKLTILFLIFMYIISVYSEGHLISYQHSRIFSTLVFRQSFITFSNLFIVGIIMRLYVKNIAKRKIFIPLFLISLVLFLGANYRLPLLKELPFLLYFYSAPVVLGILIFGIATFIPHLKFKFPDVSYGVYIYHFPIFSLLGLFGIYHIKSHIISTLVTLLICVLFSLLSFILIEKKCIQYGKKIKPYLLRS